MGAGIGQPNSNGNIARLRSVRVPILLLSDTEGLIGGASPAHTGSHIGGQLGHLIPQPGMGRITIVGCVPQQRDSDLVQLDRRRT